MKMVITFLKDSVTMNARAPVAHQWGLILREKNFWWLTARPCMYHSLHLVVRRIFLSNNNLLKNPKAMTITQCKVR